MLSMTQPSILQKSHREKIPSDVPGRQDGSLRFPGASSAERGEGSTQQADCPVLPKPLLELFTPPGGRCSFATSQPQMSRSILGTLSVITEILQCFRTQHGSIPRRVASS